MAEVVLSRKRNTASGVCWRTPYAQNKHDVWSSFESTTETKNGASLVCVCMYVCVCARVCMCVCRLGRGMLGRRDE